LAYAGRRLRAFLRPAIEVYAAPADTVIERDVPVVMADGVVLRLNVYLPPGPGPFPVILSASPYGKDALPRRTRREWTFSPQYRIMNQSEPVRFSDLTSWEAPDPARWTALGYAVINADTRGGGHSGGRGELLSDQEAHDIAEIIAWIATQRWCDGNVGMMGVSYLAISQYKVAALHPPALKAICPWEGFTDAYRDFFTPGGVVENGFARVWLTLTRLAVRLSGDFAAERRRRPLRDDWWQALAPKLGEITVPMLVCTSFSDNNLHSTGSMRAFEDAASEHRYAYTHRGPKWATFYSDAAFAAQRDFFDRFLRGKDAPEPPRVRLEVRESRSKVVAVRGEREWPLARTEWRRLALAGDGALTSGLAEAGRVTFDLRRGAVAFAHTFAEDTEVSGPMEARLFVSASGTDDPSIFVGVEKWAGETYVPFEGSYGYGRDRIAQGRLRVALRELDVAATRPHRPEHAFRTLEPLRPGEVVEVRIALTSSATLFRAGDTLRLLIAGRYLEPRNPLFGHFPTHYVPSRRGRLTISSTAERPSSLTIPVIPTDSAGVARFSSVPPASA
jgi:predicted acyl esterase